MNSILLSDGYKLSHASQYPENTTLVFSNFTPRGDKYAPKVCQNIGVTVFGPQMALIYLKKHFDENFFMTDIRAAWGHSSWAKLEISKLKESVIAPLKAKLDKYLNTDYDMSRIEALWDLGYLPIDVRALEEGTVCPIRVPMMTIHNTIAEFFWLPNFLETILSQLLWKPMTSASIALGYRKILNKWALKTTGSTDGVEWQGHDFAMRGLDSVYATISSGLGHLTSFMGTDSLPTLDGAEIYYNETGFVAGSVPATEHSVMCAGSKEDEKETFSRLLKTYPTGILSVVSDTWDLWNVITNILPSIKDEILAREGKLVIRPDSGDPVDILCGNKVDTFGNWKNFQDDEYKNISEKTFKNICESKGVVELLWDVFGGTVNEQGYKVLDPHIGAIYGDSITHERAEEICKILEAKGFASTNVVFGIGSYTYQYNTRDTFGFAMKATYVEKKVETPCGGYGTKGYEIFKDPITDDGLKKSAKGLLMVVKNVDGELELKDQITWGEVDSHRNMLKPLFKDGKLLRETTLTEVRENLKKYW